jgi:hypothetical protein
MRVGTLNWRLPAWWSSSPNPQCASLGARDSDAGPMLVEEAPHARAFTVTADGVLRPRCAKGAHIFSHAVRACACVRTVQTANSCCRSALPAQQEAPALAARHRPRPAAPGSPLLLPGGPPKGGTRAADDLRGLPGYKRRGKSNTATVNTLPIADVVTRLGNIRAMTWVNFCYCSTCKGADGLCAVICAALQHRLDVSRCLSTHTHTHTHTHNHTNVQ